MGAGRPLALCWFGIAWVLALLACGQGENNEARVWELPLGQTIHDGAFFPAEPVLDLRHGVDATKPPAAAPLLLGEGWWSTEDWGVWAVGPRSTVTASLLSGGLRFLYLDCRPSGAHKAEPQTISIEVNQTACSKIELRSGWGEYWIAIPDGLLQAGANLISFDYGHFASASNRGSESRELAVAMRRLGLFFHKPGSEFEAAWASPIRGAETGSIELVRSGAVVVPLRLPQGRNTLRLQARADLDSSGPESLSFVMSYLDSDGVVTELFAATGVGQSDLLVDDGSAGFELGDQGLCWLVFDVRFVNQKTRLILEQPRLQTRTTGGRRRVEPIPGQHPDIVVMIPDAARPDHMGCYGYRRPTTPNIDRLAGKSLVFSNAFAQASYTTCSVPTMITGLSFSRHGVIHHHQRLADEATTLAEYLKRLDYATFAVTANPYHSVNRGSDQGYSEFVETWRRFGASQEEGLDPHNLTNLAIERLQRGFDGKPFYMLLHYVPPHAPYTPPARFDVFGDPSYGGPINGERETNLALRRGELIPDASDMARLVSLYDGNLLRVDDAIGRLLDELRARPRWSDTVVLVASDHGEAFFEHGYQGHERTVYDEMIRVPFILRLPEDSAPAGIDPARQASLADIVPTLLSLVGGRPEPTVTGVDLLARPASVMQGEDRWLISRTGGERPTYGVRTGRWKAVLNEVRVRELYDLDSDPGEQNNLAAQNTLFVVGLSQLLHQALAEPGEVKAGAAGPELSPDEREALHALGYLY